MTTPDDKMREAFEAQSPGVFHWKRGGSAFAEDVPPGEYVDPGVQARWLEWQRAWNGALAYQRERTHAVAAKRFADGVSLGVDEMFDELERLRADGLHSCHPGCTRSGCVNARLTEEVERLRAQVATAWRPIDEAPENTPRPVVVGWVDAEGQDQTCFDFTEGGCWSEWHDHAEHVKVISGHGVSYTPPYTHFLEVPPLAAAPAHQEPTHD